MITFKNDPDLVAMRKAGKVVADVLRHLRDLVRPGVDTWTLDQAAEELLSKENAKPAFKGYRVPGIPKPFPGTICASINQEVVHGIPSKDRVLVEGDILSVDMGALVGGFYGDAACTYPVGAISEAREKLLAVTLNGLHEGIACVRDGATVGDVGHAVERTVLAEGCGLVREYAGHGIGRHLHESPQVPNYGKPGTGITLKSRMTICIEPMVMSGKEAVKSLSDGWTVVTVDGSDAAHFEHTVLVTAEGHEILTPWET